MKIPHITVNITRQRGPVFEKPTTPDLPAKNSEIKRAWGRARKNAQALRKGMAKGLEWTARKIEGGEK